MPNSPSYQLLLDAISRAEITNHLDNNESDESDPFIPEMKILGNKIIDLFIDEMNKNPNLTTNQILLTLTGLLSTGIVHNQKDPSSGITYAVEICRQILHHVIETNAK